MISNRPYLLRAFYQWIVDSNCTPVLVIDAHHPRCKVPKDYVEDGEIIFNISSTAVRDLKITNELIEFKASFSGVIHIVSAPIAAILAVYAEENGEGLFFDGEETDGVHGKEDVIPFTSLDGARSESIQEVISSDQQQVNAKGKPVLRLVE